jgi:hypothetical protein
VPLPQTTLIDSTPQPEEDDGEELEDVNELETDEVVLPVEEGTEEEIDEVLEEELATGPR